LSVSCVFEAVTLLKKLIVLDIGIVIVVNGSGSLF
jgi:hypothetical protein